MGAVYNSICDGEQCVSLSGLSTFMKHRMCGVSDEGIEKMFSCMDVKVVGEVSLEMFKDFCASKPMYLLILMDLACR